MDTPNDDQKFITVSLPKGCILRLTTREYAASLKRGKQWQRQQQHAARAHARGVQHEADLLAWIEEGGEAP